MNEEKYCKKEANKKNEMNEEKRIFFSLFVHSAHSF